MENEKITVREQRQRAVDVVFIVVGILGFFVGIANILTRD